MQSDPSPFSWYRLQRRKTRVVMVGKVPVGGRHPVVVQSMVTADTFATAAIVAEVIALARAGCQLVRITAPTRCAAEQLGVIKKYLRAAGCEVPLVADIHFQPEAALAAADHVAKVRINPGNYSDRKHARSETYTDAEYQKELTRIAEIFSPLILKCQANKIALRIGVNHGSLAERILNRYGDTPRGMVESALEFIRICRDYDYHDLILSLKASNPKVMIHANRLLVAMLAAEGMDYPLHLGVTEAGGGIDGRIKSAIGIGSLLADGSGDTIRVSLTEDAVKEIPVAKILAERAATFLTPSHFLSETKNENDLPPCPLEPFVFTKRKTNAVPIGGLSLGDAAPVRVQVALTKPLADFAAACAEGHILLNNRDAPLEILRVVAADQNACAAAGQLATTLNLKAAKVSLNIDLDKKYALLSAAAKVANIVTLRLPQFVSTEAGAAVDAAKNTLTTAQLIATAQAAKVALQIDISLDHKTLGEAASMVAQLVEAARELSYSHLIFSVRTASRDADELVAYRLLLGWLAAQESSAPILLHASATGEIADLGRDAFTLASAARLGGLLCDGVGAVLEISDGETAASSRQLAYDILQASGARLTRADFIACPSCGRTLFDLQATTARIRAATQHLKDIRIAIMGCIVNGPGEMADADFGYVGGAPGKINLYAGKECVARGIPDTAAVASLVGLIKEHGRWRDK